MTDTSMLCRVSRDEADALLDACRAHLAETGMAPSTFGERSCRRPSLISDLRIGRRPTRQTVARVQAFMAGAPDPVRSKTMEARHDEAVALEERRAATIAAREEHVRRHELRETQGRLGVTVQESLVDGPGDAIRAIQRRWPDLWSRVVETARSQGALPGAVMVEAIEKGLAA